MADLQKLQKQLGFKFKDLSLLNQALVHSSYLNENPATTSIPNERLEFLGDAILGLVIAEKLFQDLPDSPEGELTQLRSALVRRDSLAQAARSIDLGQYLQLGKGEEAGGGRDKAANLAGAFEALIAAIYLDHGLGAARNFLVKIFGPRMHTQAYQGVATDFKSQLQEIIQAQKQISPSYHLIEASGPDHDRIFSVEVRLGDTVLGRGTGKSKKTAETEAARVALQKFSIPGILT